jgi:conjugative transposon TraK protein
MNPFKSLLNIQKAFALTRIYLILVTVFTLLLGGYSIYASYKFAEAQRSKIYVLENGQPLLLALSHNVEENRTAEAISHVKRFHEYFFTVSPEKSAIEYNINKALFLSDNIAADYYIKLKEDGFYERIISAGILCEIMVDSVKIDDTTYPYKAYTYGKTSIIRSSSILYRNLETVCDLVNSTRTENNPHGFIIEKWKIIDNSDNFDNKIHKVIKTIYKELGEPYPIQKQYKFLVDNIDLDKLNDKKIVKLELEQYFIDGDDVTVIYRDLHLALGHGSDNLIEALSVDNVASGNDDLRGDLNSESLFKVEGSKCAGVVAVCGYKDTFNRGESVLI